ncbi:hypothetical protein E4U61_005456 [Claviceps capensis]|nr:hypothetical protein E4U61_005456 [Claviceps capensis]
MADADGEFEKTPPVPSHGAWTAIVFVSGSVFCEEIWQVGQLVDNATQTCGMTMFAATLNEITDIEKGKMALTDCRLRPDQRYAEQGDF